MEFIRGSHAALLHLSTCYVAGQRDGRVSERLRPNYTPAGLPDFNAEEEWHRLHALVESAEARAESPEVTEELKRQAMEKEHAARAARGEITEPTGGKFRARRMGLPPPGIKRPEAGADRRGNREAQEKDCPLKYANRREQTRNKAKHSRLFPVASHSRIFAGKSSGFL